MTKREYTEITRSEFKQALSETQLDFKEVNYNWTGELIYEAYSTDETFTLRVYSSLDKRTGKSRDKGSDAIRTVVLHTDSGKPVLKTKRTNRIKTWRKNLKKKISTLIKKQGNIQECEKCGSVMVIRENNKTGDEFYGCTNYPECKNTKPLDTDSR